MEVTNYTPSRLLRVPLEIRDVIYSKLLEVCQIPSGSNTIYPNLELNPNLEKPEFRRTVKYNARVRISYPKALPKYQLLPVLQTCSQIRSEFQDFIRRCQKASEGGSTRGLKYELDVVSEGRIAFASWAVLPLPPEEPYNIIEEVKVNYQVHLFRRASGRFMGNGGPGSEAYYLFYLMSNFVCHGPQGFYLPSVNASDPQHTEKNVRPDGGRCNPKIKKLILNVSFVEEETRRKSIEALRWDVAEEESGADENLNEALDAQERYRLDALKHIIMHISTMETSGYFDGHVQTIVVLHNGVKEWYSSGFGDDGEKQAMEIQVGRGFDKSPDWKPDQEFVLYSFRWGPRPEFQMHRTT